MILNLEHFKKNEIINYFYTLEYDDSKVLIEKERENCR